MNPLPEHISLVMRSYNEAWAIEDTLKAVFDQDYGGSIELIVIDSGSTDGSHEIIQCYQPKEFIILEPGTYVPGKVLNQGFKLASHEWVVFLNSDATPANRQWLTALLQAAVDAPKLGAAFSRQIPRDDCRAVFAHDYERCFGPNRESANWDHFFSMVSCVARKSVWLAHPIREDLQYAEDDEWTRRMKAAGYPTLLVENSVAIHSHNYTAAQSYKRAKGDAIAVAQAGNIPDLRRRWHRDVLLPAIKDTLRDARYCLRNGAALQIPGAFSIRYQQRLGRMHGYDEGCKLSNPQKKL
jgi:rhamnosyltransferase